MKGVLLHNSGLGINQYIIQTCSYYTIFFCSSFESSHVHENKDTGKTRGLDDMVIMQVPNHYYSISTYTFMRHILYSNLDAKWQFIKTQADLDHLMYKELCKIVTRYVPIQSIDNILFIYMLSLQKYMFLK
jgi:hypothetical protein